MNIGFWRESQKEMSQSREKNMAMGTAGHETKSDYAGEAQQQSTRPTTRKETNGKTET
jgi:hypothetical protein